MKITPQDIIDREFRVKFRGFDMAEVDAFLEEVAETLFKLSEENIQLNEKVLALQDDLQAAGGAASGGPTELPDELGSILEDLKQDTVAISSELAALKQDRPSFDDFEKNISTAIAAIKEAAEQAKTSGPKDIPADLTQSMAEFKKMAASVASELTALKESRQALETLQKDLAKVIEKAGDISTPVSSPGSETAQIPADLASALEDFKQGTEAMHSEMSVMKNDISAITGMRAEIKNEIQKLLTSQLAEFGAKLTVGNIVTGDTPPKQPAAEAAVQKPKKKGKMAVAEVIEEPEKPAEKDSRLPDFGKQDEGTAEEGDLEFLSEDDIMDVDRLRGIFQSVLDEGGSDGHESREGEEATADLLFIEDDDFIEEEHEPEVTFSLDEKDTEKKAKSKKSSTR